MANKITFPVTTSPVGVSLARNSATPLDATSVRKNKADAEAYAAGTGEYAKKHNSYVGQILSVLEDDTVNIYKIVDTAGTLELVGGNVQPEEPEEEPVTPTAYSQAATLILSSENITISNGEILEGGGLSLAAFDTTDVFTNDRTLVDVLNDIKRGKILCLGGQLFYSFNGDTYACVINNLVQTGTSIRLSGSWYKQNTNTGTYDCILIGLGDGDGYITIVAQEGKIATFDNLKTPPKPTIITVTDSNDINLQEHVQSKEVADDSGSGTTKTVFVLDADLTINIEADGNYVLSDINDEIDLGGHTLTIIGTGAATSSIDNIILTEGCTGDIFFKDISVGQNVDLNEEV